MDASKGEQAIDNGLLSVFKVFGGPKSLRCNRNHRGQGILHPMMQFFQEKPLQSLQIFVFSGFYSGLYSGLRQKAAQIDIFDLKPKLVLGGDDF